jgi:hypothetical protein
VPFIRAAKAGSRTQLFAGNRCELYRIRGGAASEIASDHSDARDLVLIGNEPVYLATDGGFHVWDEAGSAFVSEGGTGRGLSALQLYEVTGQQIEGGSLLGWPPHPERRRYDLFKNTGKTASGVLERAYVSAEYDASHGRLTVMGKRFNPDHTVTLLLDGQPAKEVEPRKDGRFTVKLRPGLAQGQHSIRAVQKAGSVVLSDTTDFVVPSADGTTAKGKGHAEQDEDEDQDEGENER